MIGHFESLRTKLSSGPWQVSLVILGILAFLAIAGIALIDMLKMSL